MGTQTRLFVLCTACVTLAYLLSPAAACTADQNGEDTECPYFTCNSTVGIKGMISRTANNGALIGRFFKDSKGAEITKDSQCVQFCQLFQASCSYWSRVAYSSSSGACFLFKSSACNGPMAFAPNVTCENSNEYSATSGQLCSVQPPAPPPPSAGVVGDPHYTGADQSHFDFTGLPGKHYCMLSDAHLHINVFHGGRYGRWGDNPHKPLTWIRQLAILWGHHSIHLAAREGPEWRYGNGYMAKIAVDGEEVAISQPGESADFVDGHIKIQWVAARERSGQDEIDVYEVAIVGVLRMIVRLRPEVSILRTAEDGVVHFGLEIPRLAVSTNVHGVLGQTFRSDHQNRLASQNLVHSDLLKVDVIPGENAEGFLDGQAADYETSSLFKADCKFSRFARATLLDPETAQAIELSGASVSGSSTLVSSMERSIAVSK